MVQVNLLQDDFDSRVSVLQEVGGEGLDGQLASVFGIDVHENFVGQLGVLDSTDLHQVRGTSLAQQQPIRLFII